MSGPAHITIGVKVGYVRKIQNALSLLDGANIDLDGAYGPETAAAVLAYKQKRNTVNRRGADPRGPGVLTYNEHVSRAGSRSTRSASRSDHDPRRTSAGLRGKVKFSFGDLGHRFPDREMLVFHDATRLQEPPARLLAPRENDERAKTHKRSILSAGCIHSPDQLVSSMNDPTPCVSACFPGVFSIIK